MKRTMRLAAFILSILLMLPLSAGAAQLLVPVGAVIGLQLHSDTVTVAAFDDSTGAAAKSAGLKIGDEILSIDDLTIDSTEDVRSALRSCDSDIRITIRRDGKQSTLRMTPEETEDGPRLGVYLRQGIAGIGTVTYYDPETGRFGTLGHGVSDGKGSLVRLQQGQAFEAQVGSVIRGKSGEPGQLKGSADPLTPFGTILRNTPQGVFGTTTRGWPGQPLPVGSFSDVKTGSATIRSTVAGDAARDYSVEILKIYPRSRSGGRNFLIRVTDPQLLAVTGGIVQGMSGSPIIQDGKLIGAVTHVLVNSPDTGYGIFIENMLEAAS